MWWREGQSRRSPTVGQGQQGSHWTKPLGKHSGPRTHETSESSKHCDRYRTPLPTPHPNTFPPKQTTQPRSTTRLTPGFTGRPQQGRRPRCSTMAFPEALHHHHVQMLGQVDCCSMGASRGLNKCARVCVCTCVPLHITWSLLCSQALSRSPLNALLTCVFLFNASP